MGEWWAVGQRWQRGKGSRLAGVSALIAVLVALFLVAPDSGRSLLDAQTGLPAPELTSQAVPAGNAAPAALTNDIASIDGVLGPARDGYVQFYLCLPALVTPGGGCQSRLAMQVGSMVPVKDGQATSDPAATFGLGLHCWRLDFFGSEFYAAASHTNATSECFGAAHVGVEPRAAAHTREQHQQAPVIEPVAFVSTHAVPSGRAVSPVLAAFAIATIVGNYGSPSGTVQFFLCGPGLGDNCLAPAGQPFGGPVALVEGSASSPPMTLTAPGTYCWWAEYSGDYTYSASFHALTNLTDADECVEVVQGEVVQGEVVQGGVIAQIVDAEADRLTDGDGNPFYEVTSVDGATTIRVRDLPSGVTSFRVDLITLDAVMLANRMAQLGPDAQVLIDFSTSVPIASELLVTDTDGGGKLAVQVEIELDAPPLDPQFLLWLIEGESGRLEPLEFQVLPGGRLLATAPFDLIFLILDIPAPVFSLRQGLNAVVYTGPHRLATDAFPGGPGRGDGIQALWRFTGFGFVAFFPSAPALADPTYRLYDPLFVSVESTTAVMQQALLVPVRRNVSLVGGANFVAYTGSGGAIVDVMDAGVLARTSVVWVWRDSIGAWLGFFPGAPPAINGLTSIQIGDLIFIQSTGPVGWDIR